MSHVPVLLHESIDGLALKSGATVIDGTLGAGGHASEIARRFGKDVAIIGFDVDENAIALAKENVSNAGGNLEVIMQNFRTMHDACTNRGIDEVQGILLDLGVSSMELGASGRGFSFKYDEPLLMTLATHIDESTLTAEDIVNGESEESLADIIFRYGEERFSRRIAKAIVTARKKERVTTTGQLVEVINGAVPAFYRNGRLHPATRTFQALRIATNDELGALKDGLAGGYELLAEGGRMAVITFHSLEDRIVKEFFKIKKTEGATLITKKPLAPTDEELKNNPRSRSAKLRIIQK